MGVRYHLYLLPVNRREVSFGAIACLGVKAKDRQRAGKEDVVGKWWIIGEVREERRQERSG